MTSSGRLAIIIVNSIAPYAFEINNYLGLPNGFSYRFRYQKSESSDWMPTINDPRDLEGVQALVITRNFDTAELFPVRTIEIQNVSTIGDVVYLDYNLGDLFGLESTVPDRERQLKRFSEFMEDAIGDYENVPGEDLDNLIFFTENAEQLMNHEMSKEKTDLEKWGTLVRELGQIDVYEDFDFLKIVEVSASDQTSAKITTANGESKYQLINNKKYDIEIIQRTFTGKPEGDSSVSESRVISVECGDGINRIKNQRNITGKYDLFEFKIQPASRSPPANSFLWIELENITGEMIYSIQIPVNIVTSLKEKAVNYSSVAIFLISASIFLLSPSIAEVSLSPGIRNFLIVVMIVAASVSKRPSEGYLSLVGLR